MRHLRRTSSGYVAMRTGTEGPRHDPYSFTEYEIERGPRTITLHLGLGVWLKRNGREFGTKMSENDKVGLFEKVVGFDLKQFERALHRLPRMSKRERRSYEEIEAADQAMYRNAI